MKRAQGFILIECCVYLLLCVMLATTLMRWMAQTVAEAGMTMQRIDRSVMHILVHDIFMRDLYMAPSKKSAWITIQSDCLIWQTPEGKAIAWQNRDNQLIRQEGIYNVSLRQWGKHHSSIIAHNLTQFACEPHGDTSSVHAVTTTLSIDDTKPMRRYIRIRNGKV